jgi:hypothetical protein
LFTNAIHDHELMQKIMDPKTAPFCFSVGEGMVDDPASHAHRSWGKPIKKKTIREYQSCLSHNWPIIPIF